MQWVLYLLWSLQCTSVTILWVKEESWSKLYKQYNTICTLTVVAWFVPCIHQHSAWCMQLSAYLLWSLQCTSVTILWVKEESMVNSSCEYILQYTTDQWLYFCTQFLVKVVQTIQYNMYSDSGCLICWGGIDCVQTHRLNTAYTCTRTLNTFSSL